MRPMASINYGRLYSKLVYRSRSPNRQHNSVPLVPTLHSLVPSNAIFLCDATPQNHKAQAFYQYPVVSTFRSIRPFFLSLIWSSCPNRLDLDFGSEQVYFLRGLRVPETIDGLFYTRIPEEPCDGSKLMGHSSPNNMEHGSHRQT